MRVVNRLASLFIDQASVDRAKLADGADRSSRPSSRMPAVSWSTTRSSPALVRAVNVSCFSAHPPGGADRIAGHNGVRGDMTVHMRRSALQVRHLILFVVCLMYFVAYVDRVNISIAGPLIRRDLG